MPYLDQKIPHNYDSNTTDRYTNQPTNKQTNQCKTVTSLAEVIIRSAFPQTQKITGKNISIIYSTKLAEQFV